MKNPMTVLVVLLVFGLVSFGVYGFTRGTAQNENIVENEEVMMDKDSVSDEVMMEKDEQGDEIVTKSRYAPYSKEILESSSNTRRVLFFYASWCPTCKPADASFSKNADKIPDDVSLIRVNYNDPDTDQEEKDLAKKYGITYQHTYVQIDGNGEEVTKWNGGAIEELLTRIK